MEPRGEVEEWWTLSQAESQTGVRYETIRSWAQKKRVTADEVMVGKRRRIRVSVEDVLREAQLNRTYAGQLPKAPEIRSPDTASRQDRAAVLEEVARLNRTIESHREEIERHHREIERRHREIEELLLAPSPRPSKKPRT